MVYMMVRVLLWWLLLCQPDTNWVILEEGPSIEKMSLSDWPVGESMEETS